MSDDTRFDSYLSARASGLELPPANLGSVLDRVAQRRRHRRAAASACVAVAVLGGALSVVNVGGSDAPEHVVARAGGGNLVASSLEWTSVTPRVGLSWSSGTIVGPDNALYSLSTAPGSTGDDGSQQVLYRSTDGIEWAAASLPDGLHPSSIAAAGQSLYAVGTAPAGGNTGVQLASSTTAGATWSKVDVPVDLAALESRYGVRVGINGLSVGGNGTQTVIAVTLAAQDAVDRLIPGGVTESQGYSIEEDGITVYAPFDKAAVAAAGRGTAQTPEVSATYTWEQLGVDASLRSLVLGETRMFVSENGSAFAPAAVLSVRPNGPVLTTTAGFRMVGSPAGTPESTMVLSSVDGRTWQADPLATTAGWVMSSGVRRDLVALATSSQTPAGTQSSTIRMQQPGGTWSEIDVIDVLHRAGATGDYLAGGAAVGPLGVAVLMTEARDGDDAHRYLVTTTDGNDVSVIDLGKLLAGSYPGDVRVTADAISVAVHSGGENPTTKLLVGTPPR